MRSSARQHGFSLLETLLAVSTLAIGMIFVGGTFLTGIYLATVSTERTIATVAVDEALAKIRIYGLDPNDPDLKTDALTPYADLVSIPSSESLYPSTDANSLQQYSWATLCRRMDSESRLVQITVFVSRQAGTNARYWARSPGTDELDMEQVELPHPVRVNVVWDAGDPNDELTIEDAVTSDGTDEQTFINDGATIVDDETGQIYRVLERYAEPSNRIKLDRPWEGVSDAGKVWVVPRPVSGGRSPQVAVYQEVLRF